MIVTFSGASGVGKTTIYRALLERISGSSMLVSHTTRDKRDSDIPYEYRYIKSWYSKFWFWLLNWSGAFLWIVDIHGNKYGTLKWFVRKGLKNNDEIYFMNITPDKVVELYNYACERGSEEFIISIYILAPLPAILRKRLEERGESEFEVKKRLRDCERWDSEAKSSAIPFIFIRNNLEPIVAVEEALDFINERKEELE